VEQSEGVQREVTITYKHCRTRDEFRACKVIEHEVWNDPELEVPITLYIVAVETGGQVFGAFDGERMIGFTHAVPGFRDGRIYLHSHQTGVLKEARNRGVGRGLKLFQRADALARGIDRIEWTFDPLKIKNAYFNLMRLGATVRRFVPNCYGVTESPLHGGLPTDRLVAEWELRSERIERCLRHEAPVASVRPDAVRIAVPKTIDGMKLSDPAAARGVQDRIREEFQKWLGLGYTVVALETEGEEACYVLEPGESGKENPEV
jgi:predicted GNAT superfamily acetyltransferase